MTETGADNTADRDEAAFDELLKRYRPRLPLWTYVLIVANLGMFAVTLGFSVGTPGPGDDVYVRLGAVHGPGLRQGEYWRLLTAAFLHAGFLHLLFNQWALWDVGRLAERVYGRAAFLCVYACSAVAGGLGSFLFHDDQSISVGASGAIFGICGALGVFLLIDENAVPAAALRRLWKSVGGLAAYSLVLGLTQPGVDNAAHFAGLFGGAIAGLVARAPIDGQIPRLMPLRLALLLSIFAGIAVGAVASVSQQVAEGRPAPFLVWNTLRRFDQEVDRLTSLQHHTFMTTQQELLADAILGRLLPSWQALDRDLTAAAEAVNGTGESQLVALARDYVTAKIRFCEEYASGFRDNEQARVDRGMAADRAADEIIRQYRGLR